MWRRLGGVALSGYCTACGVGLSSNQPAHVPDQGHAHAELGVDVSYPTGTIPDVIRAAESVEQATDERAVSNEEKRKTAPPFTPRGSPVLVSVLLITTIPASSTIAATSSLLRTPACSARAVCEISRRAHHPRLRRLGADVLSHRRRFVRVRWDVTPHADEAVRARESRQRFQAGGR